MELSPEEKERIYLEEKERAEARARAEQELANKKAAQVIAVNRANAQKAAKQAQQGFIGCISTVVVLVIFGIVGFNSCASNTSSSTDNSNTMASSSINIGDDGVLRNGDNQVPVAASEQAQSDLTNAAVAKDEVGYEQIFLRGDAFMVPAGTKAKLIGYGSGLLGAAVYHIRIEGGDHDTEDGWVPMEWLVKR